MLQNQTEPKKIKRGFCEIFIKDDNGDFTTIHCSDEANFHLSGHLNKQNMRFCVHTKTCPDTLQAKYEVLCPHKAISRHVKSKI